MKIVVQSFVIIFSTLIVFLIMNTQAIDYMPMILGGIMLIALLVIVFKRRRGQKDIFTGSSIEIFALTTVILLIIFLTGGLKSNIFFLIYFLLFGITFMFEPVVIFILLATLLLLFVQQALTEDVFSNMMKLGSLILLTPLAFFFGNEYKKRTDLEDNVKERSEQIAEDAEGLLRAEAEKLGNESVEKIDHILEEADDLKKEAEE